MTAISDIPAARAIGAAAHPAILWRQDHRVAARQFVCDHPLHHRLAAAHPRARQGAVSASCNGAGSTRSGACPTPTTPRPAARCADSAPAGPSFRKNSASSCSAPIRSTSNGGRRLAVLVFIALFFVSSRRWAWRKELALVWAGALAADRPVDVGRHSRAALRVAGPLGRPAGDADPCHLRPRVRLSARHPRRARPALETAGDQVRCACSMSN